MEMGGSILINNDTSFLSIPTAWPQESLICQILGIMIYIGVCGSFPPMPAEFVLN